MAHDTQRLRDVVYIPPFYKRSECVFLVDIFSSVTIDQICCSDLTCDPLRVIETSAQHAAADDSVSLGIKPRSPFWIRELNSSYKGKGSNFTGIEGTNKLFNLSKVDSHKKS